MAITKYTTLHYPSTALRSIAGIPNRIERFFDGDRHNPSLGWTPPVNVVETKDEIVVTVELPGVERTEGKIELDGGHRTTHGAQSNEDTVSAGGDHSRLRVGERSFGSFRRSFVLPRAVISNEGVSAHFIDGILTGRVPKATEAKSRLIEITS